MENSKEGIIQEVTQLVIIMRGKTQRVLVNWIPLCSKKEKGWSMIEIMFIKL